jgi:hypothetical protein
MIERTLSKALGLTMADVFEEKPSVEQSQAETVGA